MIYQLNEILKKDSLLKRDLFGYSNNLGVLILGDKFGGQGIW